MFECSILEMQRFPFKVTTRNALSLIKLGWEKRLYVELKGVFEYNVEKFFSFC